MSEGGKGLVTAEEPTVVAKLFPDTIVMEDGQDDEGLPGPTCADESDGHEFVHESNDPLHQLFASKECPGGGGDDSPCVPNADMRYQIHLKLRSPTWLGLDNCEYRFGGGWVMLTERFYHQSLPGRHHSTVNV